MSRPHSDKNINGVIESKIKYDACQWLWILFQEPQLGPMPSDVYVDSIGIDKWGITVIAKQDGHVKLYTAFVLTWDGA